VRQRRECGITASAVVTLKTHSKPLAVELWKTNKQGDTWEYIYFVDEVRTQRIPYTQFNEVAGYKKNAIVQRFNVLSSQKSAAILQAFDLASENYYPPSLSVLSVTRRRLTRSAMLAPLRLLKGAGDSTGSARGFSRHGRAKMRQRAAASRTERGTGEGGHWVVTPS